MKSLLDKELIALKRFEISMSIAKAGCVTGFLHPSLCKNFTLTSIEWRYSTYEKEFTSFIYRLLFSTISSYVWI